MPDSSPPASSDDTTPSPPPASESKDDKDARETAQDTKNPKDKNKEDETKKDPPKDPHKWTLRFLAAAVLIMGGILLAEFVLKRPKDEKEETDKTEAGQTKEGEDIIVINPIDKNTGGGLGLSTSAPSETVTPTPKKRSNTVNVLFWLIFSLNLVIGLGYLFYSSRDIISQRVEKGSKSLVDEAIKVV